MNVFVLDNDVEACARYHVDKHCVKMILETTQLLNNALIKHDHNYSAVYRQTHKNHPASIWCAETSENFSWLLNLGLALCSEYTFRYNKRHKCQSIIEFFKTCESRKKIPEGNLTSFKLCMPAVYHTDDAVRSYRMYYRNDKAHIAKWTKRNVPDWWDDLIYKKG